MDETSQSVSQKNVFNTVTPFSKFLALALFVCMPFVGGWIGYSYAPEKLVVIEQPAATIPENEEVLADETPPVVLEEEGTYEWCIKSGGQDVTPDYNTPRSCEYMDRMYEEFCVENEKYFVILKETYGISQSKSIVVKNKETADQKFECVHNVAPQDFEIENSGPDWLLALEGDYLLISSATGPGPAGLRVYNLGKRELVYSGLYSYPITIKNSLFAYWEEIPVEATAENCPQFTENESNWLGSALEEYVVLNLNTLTKAPLGEQRCTSRQ